MAASLTVDAPAKLNLFLHVTGRRPDGYHLLQSLFVFTEFGDRLHLEPADGLYLELEGPYAGQLAALGGLGPNNLITKAADALRHAFSLDFGAKIILEKRIPVAAGVGGGSSDAAAALLGLSRLWGIEVGADRLNALALGLGADVPACLERGPQWVEGIGERRQRVEGLPEMWAVLVNPRQPLSTAEVFGDIAAQQKPYSDHISVPNIQGQAWWSWLGLIVRNDLEAAGTYKVPQIGDILRWVTDVDGCRLARMSGSGPTVFALFDTAAAAQSAAEDLAGKKSDWWVAYTRVLRK